MLHTASIERKDDTALTDNGQMVAAVCKITTSKHTGSKWNSVHSPVRSVPMTLMANLATLRDLGRAYWVHKYDSNWIAKI